MMKEKKNWVKHKDSQLFASMPSVVTMAALIFFCLWLFQQEQYGLGWTISSKPVRDSQILSEIKVPLTNKTKLLLIPRVLITKNSLEKRWIMARGKPRVLDSGHVVLEVNQLSMFPSWLTTLNILPIHNVLQSKSIVLVVLGIAIVLIAYRLLSILAYMTAGIFGVFVTWHLVVFAGFEGYITLPPGGTELISATGALIGGAWVSWSKVTKFVFKRIALLVVLLSLYRGISVVFGVSFSLAQLGCVIGSTISPAFGLAILSGFLVSLGLVATPPVSVVILSILMIWIHVVLKGKWVPERIANKVVQKMKSRYPKGRYGFWVTDLLTKK